MRVDIDQRGISQLDLQPAMKDQMVHHAKRIASYARRMAPTETGKYRRSIRAERDVVARAVALVTSDDPKAMIMEYGSKHNRAFHTLVIACKRAGYRTYEVLR